MTKKKDGLEKLLVSHKDVFVQLWSRLGRRQYNLDSDGLEEAPTEGIVLADPQPVQGFRDILMRYKNKANLQLIYFGIENQTTVDKYMAVRVLNYASQTYDNQRRQKCEPFSPVFTRVVYFGYEKRWDGPRSIRELVGELPPEMEDEFNDFSFDVIELAWLSDEEIDRLENDLRALALFLRDLRLKRTPTGSSDTLKHRAEMFSLIKAISNIELTENDYADEPEGGVTMCEFIENWKKELIEQGVSKGLEKGREEGLEKGLEKGREEGRKEERQAIADNLRKLGLTETVIQQAILVC